jgi:predicted ATP-binding protein involved in virulence
MDERSRLKAMNIKDITIENFRGIEHLQLSFNPQFNLIIGENGQGKTAVLEAIAVGIGCFFTGIPGVAARHIRDEDIRYFKSVEGSYEYARPTKVEITASLLGDQFRWHKSREGLTGTNVIGARSPIKSVSERINRQIKNSNRTVPIDLPVLAYYSTARLWKESREHKKEATSQADKLPTRYRGYRDALDIKSTFKIMLDWFKGSFADVLANGETSDSLTCVKNVVTRNIPNASNIKWVFTKEKIQTLYVVFHDGTETPFHFLSDGYRNALAVFADLAYRCVTLNPHFRHEANLNTEGVVLIDELDLHLHPSWQKKIIRQLKETFPRIQFIATTHSPFLIQETSDGELFNFFGNREVSRTGGSEYSLEDIARFLQKIDNPGWSSEKKDMYEVAKEYFQLLQELTPETDRSRIHDIRERLNILGSSYSNSNVAYTAFLEQKRALAEQRLNGML